MVYNILIHKRTEMNDNPIESLFTGILIVILIPSCVFLGTQLSKDIYIDQGRVQGIVLCTEKPEQCKIEYTYLKLKENQK